MGFENIISSFANKIYARSSVLTPLLWLCGISVPTFLIAAAYIPLFATTLIATPICLIGITVIVYIAWAVTDPNRLQSEEFLNRQTELQLMQNMDTPPIIDGASLIVNPNASHASGNEVTS